MTFNQGASANRTIEDQSHRLCMLHRVMHPAWRKLRMGTRGNLRRRRDLPTGPHGDFSPALPCISWQTATSHPSAQANQGLCRNSGGAGLRFHSLRNYLGAGEAEGSIHQSPVAVQKSTMNPRAEGRKASVCQLSAGHRAKPSFSDTNHLNP